MTDTVFSELSLSRDVIKWEQHLATLTPTTPTTPPRM